METKQVIVIRKDLNMRKGKMCAQAAHASMKVVLDNMKSTWDGAGIINKELTLKADEPLYHWIRGIFTKIVVSCDSEEQLLALQSLANINGILNALIEDAGKTEFGGKPTYTALAIGPDVPEKIDAITGHLKLL